MKKSLLLIGMLWISSLAAQELYIRTEPASNLPKGVIGIRTLSEFYQEGAHLRNMTALRVMYGVSPRLTVWAQGNISNHHDRTLPDDLIDDEGGVAHTHDILTGEKYPMLFNGFQVYGKYLFLKADQQNKHFRMAAYAEASTAFTAHDEAEPNLMDDNAGLGAGIIMTQLYHRFAASLTVGGTLPFAYTEKETDIRLQYGNALQYNLSFGYLLMPFKYKDYSQTNVSLYVEFLGKSYGEGSLSQAGTDVFVGLDTPALLASSFVEVHPGIQFIFNSNTRLDLGMGFRFLNESYRYTYPLYFVQVQHYLF